MHGRFEDSAKLIRPRKKSKTLSSTSRPAVLAQIKSVHFSPACYPDGNTAWLSPWGLGRA